MQNIAEAQLFNKRFKEILEEKLGVLKEPLLSRIDALLMVFHRYNILDVISPNTMLARLRDITLVGSESVAGQGKSTLGGFFPYPNAIVLRNMGRKIDEQPRLFIHELIHALSTSFEQLKPYNKGYDYPSGSYAFGDENSNFENARKLVEKFGKDDGFTIDDVEADDEGNVFIKGIGWIDYNIRGTVDKVNTIKPIAFKQHLGFYEAYVEMAKRYDVEIKSTKDLTSWINNRAHGEYVFKFILDPKYNGFNEGATELLASFVEYIATNEKPIKLFYDDNVYVAEMCGKIFGDDFWKGFFTGSFKPMLEHLNLQFKDIEEIVNISKIGDLKEEGYTADEIYSNSVYVQLKCLKLFERKMIYEIVKHKDDFCSSLDMRHAIMRGYFDFTNSFYFGKPYPFISMMPYMDDAWNKVKESVDRVWSFGNKQLVMSKRKTMPPIKDNFIEFCMSYNANNSAYLHYDGNEISVKDNLASYGPLRAVHTSEYKMKKDWKHGFEKYGLSK